MKLSSLLADFYPFPLQNDKDVFHLSLDSRSIKPGDVFLALPGIHLHGEKFIDDAIQRGASAILMDANESAIHWRDTLPMIAIPSLKAKVPALAARCYDDPTKKLRI